MKTLREQRLSSCPTDDRARPPSGRRQRKADANVENIVVIVIVVIIVLFVLGYFGRGRMRG
jgi:hypothetical protein